MRYHECVSGTHNCISEKAICSIPLGSDKCTCKSGYRGHGRNYFILDGKYFIDFFEEELIYVTKEILTKISAFLQLAKPVFFLFFFFALLKVH